MKNEKPLIDYAAPRRADDDLNAAKALMRVAVWLACFSASLLIVWLALESFK